MRLKAFKIKNFRSVIETDWSELSEDNMTALIGQNESGKTTVLEALHSFYSAKINEDILRSDLSMPVVYCLFDTEGFDVDKALNPEFLPDGVSELIKKNKQILLVREWTGMDSSAISIKNEKIVDLYQKFSQEEKRIEDELMEKSKGIIELYENSDEELKRCQKEYNLIKEKSSQDTVRNSLSWFFGKTNGKIVDQATTTVPEKDIKKLNDKIDRHKKILDENNASYNIALGFLSVQDRFRKTCHEREVLRNELKKLQRLNIMGKESGDHYETGIKLKKLKGIIEESERDCQHWQKEYRTALRTSLAELSGVGHYEAERSAQEIVNKSEQYYKLEELGALLFDYVPQFDFFEDFSSLLPNRIDLEDISENKDDVEGIRAAKNFLTIASLDKEFFLQSNSRILKQKIESLNTELTINFQDYWSQTIGKNNKIKLNFELEHYDYTNPEKRGKPYLEFWIKDKNERLYPKQRSRGVRWILSFYLELKASAMSGKKHVLLIDEPGVSLHARAQEDVLKVFEDIKENLQIIYTTHSPHLLNSDKFYRVLAVQRANEEDENSETRIFTPQSLYSASYDTLSPIYVLMGAQINRQRFIQPENNIIVEDMRAFYYLRAVCRILNLGSEFYFLPATGVSSVPLLANLLIGWNLGFKILLTGKNDSMELYNDLKENLYPSDEHKAKENILLLRDFLGYEDVFSTLDFKKYILKKRVGIVEKNSEYIDNHHLSGNHLASDFLNLVECKKMTLSDFDEETQENIQKLGRGIKRLLTSEK